ncbi:MAG: pentapeptide repeat-containing protein, partial [Pirellulales bacterium]
TDAGLAEIDWEEADLRGADLRRATFHMGSSRSGRVGSPIACEGSKTGFYTDDLEDMTFKPPEEVRKANLRGADLRDVHAEGVDFYLVDLRDAKMHPILREQARQSGAILEDFAS